MMSQPKFFSWELRQAEIIILREYRIEYWRRVSEAYLYGERRVTARCWERCGGMCSLYTIRLWPDRLRAVASAATLLPIWA